MECLFQDAMIQLFASSFQSFSKISTDLILQYTEDGVQFHIMGHSFQSYLSLAISKECFSSFQCSNPHHYGMSSKAISFIFKDWKHLESVHMKVEQNDIDYNIVFEMICHHKVRKVYRIRLFDSDIANITFDTTQAPNQISIRPDLLSKAIQYLQTESEIIMKVFPSTLSIENIPAEGEVRTVSNLSTADVDDISISSATSLRFLTSGLLVVLHLMHIQDIKMVQLQFGDGGSILRVKSKPGCDRPGVSIEYLLLTSPEDAALSHDQVLDSMPATEFQDKRVEVDNRSSDAENDDEFWKRRQNDEEEWYYDCFFTNTKSSLIMQKIKDLWQM